ncbi:MAG TPA: PD-(D/E)XK nuclease family protein, partial [Candidatus Saccharimonadales bacterium]|nr:PD-(D/E)XK nuclease family protein [Candidatus Saccharimonadales bacterium]
PGGARRSLDALPAPGGGVDRERLDPGLELLETIESFAPGDLRYDALVGGAALQTDRWSPTRLETMGNCPQQYFFRHVLHVDELDALLEEHELDAAELGSFAHRILQEIYSGLDKEKAFPAEGGDPYEAARIALALLGETWEKRFASVARGIHDRYPLLWEGLSGLWRSALSTFILDDLAAMARDGSRVIAVEHAVSAELPLGAGLPALPIRGRFDRVLRDATGGSVVGDYKTMGRLANRVNAARMLKGLALQIPLYVLMREAEEEKAGPRIPTVGAEVIGVGPAFCEGPPPAGPDPGGYASVERLEPGKMSEIREGLLETIGILSRTAAAGVFPFNPKSERCSWCPYARACRKGHEPSRERIAGSGEARAYLLLDGKSTRRPLLSTEADPGEEGS